MLTVQDLQGSAKRRRREALMRGVFFTAAAASVVISVLILVVLFRGLLTFMGKIDWDFSLLNDTGWFPRSRPVRSHDDPGRESRDGSDLPHRRGALRSGHGDLPVRVRAFAVRSVLKPVIEVLAGMPSVVVGFFALSFIAPDFTQKLSATPTRRTCSSRASGSASSSSRSWRRCRGRAAVGTRLAP